MPIGRTLDRLGLRPAPVSRAILLSGTALPTKPLDLTTLGPEIAAAADGTYLRNIAPWVGAADGGSTDLTNQNGLVVYNGVVRNTNTSGTPYHCEAPFGSVCRRYTYTVNGLPATDGKSLAIYLNDGGNFSISQKLYLQATYTAAKSGFTSLTLTRTVRGTSTSLAAYDYYSTPILTGDKIVVEVTGQDVTTTVYRGATIIGTQRVYTYPASTYGTATTTNSGEAWFFTAAQFVSPNQALDNGAVTVTQLTRLAIDPVQPVFQRNKSGAAKQITFVGSCASTTTAIEAQLVNASDGSVVTAWASAPASFSTSGNRFAIFYSVPTGGNYRLQVRDKAVPATVSSTNDFGVGAIILAYGQSNIGHWRADNPTGGVDNVRGAVFDGLSGPYIGSRPLSRDTGGTTLGAGGAGAVNDYIASANFPVLLITQGVDGAGVASLNKGASGYNYYANMIAEVMYLGGKLEGIFWEQGHTEAPTLSQSNNQANYMAAVTSIAANIRADCGQTAADLPFLITLMPPNPELKSTGTSTTAAGYQLMRQTQIALAGSIPNAYLADHEMDAVFQSETSPYNGHYTTNYLESGRRKARSLALALGFVTTDLRGALPQSCTVSGNQLMITYNLNGGTGITLPTTSSPPSDWQVAVNDPAFGSLNAVTAATISGNQVTLTLTTALTPGQTVYVRNGYGYWFDRSNTFKTTYASGASVATFPIVTALSAVD